MANLSVRRPAGSARFIGHVGALAVALGIGAAVASNPAIALAETGDGGGSSSGAGAHRHGGHTKESKPAAESHRGEAPRRGSKDTKQARSASATPTAATADPQTSTSAVDTETKRQNSHKLRRQAAPVSASAGAPTPVTGAVPKSETKPVAQKVVSAAPAAAVASAPEVASVISSEASTPSTLTSVLANPGQLAAEKKAKQLVATLPVQLMKFVLTIGFALEGEFQFRNVGGLNWQNLKQIGSAVNEYIQQAAMEYQLLDPLKPTVLQMVMPPHTWMGQTVPGTRILYDNPDTIYRMMAVNATSTYVITGKFGPGEMPADTSFSVLTGLGGKTAAVLNAKDMQINADGSFTITVGSKPAAPGQTNYLQIPKDASLIAARNTVSDWGSQEPMSLSIERTSGPRDSLFAQIGGFQIPGLGSTVAGNAFLTNLLSLIPPLPVMPRFVAGLETAVVAALGLVMQPEYMGVATGNGTRPANVFTDPESNATFLATQLQSPGTFRLSDNQALVLTINPGNAGYFVVPVTNDWTITTNYWDQQTTLNIAQSVANSDGTYTIVVSPTDPGVANWVSTGGLNQGTISIRFQDIDTSRTDTPTVGSQVVSLDELDGVLPVGTTYVTQAQRQAILAQRKAGYDNRYAPYPQS